MPGLLEALRPFVDFASVPAFKHFADDFVLTMGSRMALRQLTAGDFRKLLAALPAPETRWRHKKRGTEYVEIGKAQLQSADAVYEPAILIVYRDAEGGLWARPKAEFEDGRFELLENDHA